VRKISLFMPLTIISLYAGTAYAMQSAPQHLVAPELWGQSVSFGLRPTKLHHRGLGEGLTIPPRLSHHAPSKLLRCRIEWAEHAHRLSQAYTDTKSTGHPARIPDGETTQISRYLRALRIEHDLLAPLERKEFQAHEEEERLDIKSLEAKERIQLEIEESLNYERAKAEEASGVSPESSPIDARSVRERLRRICTKKAGLDEADGGMYHNPPLPQPGCFGRREEADENGVPLGCC